jgi:hypothetical protein
VGGRGAEGERSDRHLPVREASAVDGRGSDGIRLLLDLGLIWDNLLDELGHLLRGGKRCCGGSDPLLIGEVCVQTILHHLFLAVVENLLGRPLALGVTGHQLLQELLLIFLTLHGHGIRRAGNPVVHGHEENVHDVVTTSLETFHVCLGLLLCGENTADLHCELAALLSAELGSHKTYQCEVLAGDL